MICDLNIVFPVYNDLFDLISEDPYSYLKDQKTREDLVEFVKENPPAFYTSKYNFSQNKGVISLSYEVRLNNYIELFWTVVKKFSNNYNSENKIKGFLNYIQVCYKKNDPLQVVDNVFPSFEDKNKEWWHNFNETMVTTI